MKRSLVLAVLVATVAGTQAFAGVYFTSVTVNEGQKGADIGNMTVRGWAEGEKARIEITESKHPLMIAGGYLLTLDGGATIYLVDPKEKTFSKWDMDAMMGAVGGVMQGTGGLVSMRFSDPKVEKLADEDGEAVAGMPTRRYHYRTSYSSEFTMMGLKQSSQVLIEEDLWVATKLIDAGLGVWLRKEPKKTGNEEFDRLVAAQQSKYEGFPLKRVAVTTTTDKKGRQTVVKTTTTVTELKTGTVPEGTFVMGSGYREKPLMLSGKAGDESEPPQESEQYPFETMLEPQPEAAKPAAPQPRGAQPAVPGRQPQQPQQPPQPPAEPQPEEPQEDPEYPFDLMLDSSRGEAATGVQFPRAS